MSADAYNSNLGEYSYDSWYKDAMMSFNSNPTVNSENREQYKQYVATLDMPIQELDALISIVDSILSYFVDQAFHVQTDQITLRSIGKTSFKALAGHATIGNDPENQAAAALQNGVVGDSNPIGPSEP